MKKLLCVLTLSLLGCNSAAIQGQKCDVPPPTKMKPMLHNVQVMRKLHLNSRFTPEEVVVI